METTIYKQLSAWQLWGQVKLAPELLAAARKDRLGTGLSSLPSSSELKHAVQIGPGATVLAILLCLAQGIANHLFRQDRFLAVRFVVWPRGLKVKTECAA